MSNEARLGLFVIIVIVVFMFFTVNMGSRFFAGEQRLYLIYFTDMGTLEVGAPVKQAGFNIGEVDKIYVKKQGGEKPTVYVIVEVRVSEEAIISQDSRASIQTLGMMGEKYVEITFGSLEELEEGSRIDGQGPYELTQVIETALTLTDDVRETVQNINKILGDEKLQENIVNLINNLEQFSKDINSVLGGEENRLDHIMVNAEAASANLVSLIATAELFITDAHDVVNENKPYLTKTLKNTSELSESLRENLVEDLNGITKQLNSLAVKLEGSLDNADRMIAKVGNLIDESHPEIQNTIKNLKEFSDNARTVSDRVDSMLYQIENEEGMVHDLIYDKEFSQAAKETVTQVSGYLTGVSDFKKRFGFEVEFRYFSGRPRFDRDDNDFRVDFGVSYDINERLFTYIGGNNVGASTELEAQLGFRWEQLIFHGGMIESEIGLGVDWQIWDRFLIGIEGIGLTDNNEERLDAYSEFLLWEHLSLVGGIQDLTDEMFPNVGVKWRF